MLGLFMSTAWGQAAETATAAPAKPGMMEIVFPFVLILFVFYFFQNRPQQKKLKLHQDFLTSLKRGDQVITTSGILGEITGISDKFITLQIDDNVRIKIIRSQIMSSAKEGNA
jgi:preprotein translocase subunit YajC